MGKDLCVAVEVYDRTLKKWVTMSVEGLKQGSVIPYDHTKAVESAKIRILKGCVGIDYEDLQGEAESAAMDDCVIPIGRNYDLFAYIAGVENREGRIRQQSGTRGKPLDSSTKCENLGSSFASFLTLAEISHIKWTERIDVPVVMGIRDYTHPFTKYSNLRGDYLKITEEEWVRADETARKKLLHHNLHISVDKPIYLQNIKDFLQVVGYMEKLPAASHKGPTEEGAYGDPNDVRMIMMFTY